MNAVDVPHIDVAVLAVVISGLVLLIQLYRWLAGFASKPEVAKIEQNLNEKLSATGTSLAIANARIEGQVKEHRAEAVGLLGKLSDQVGEVLTEVRSNTVKIADLRGWREEHVEEDRVAHKVIAEVRDYMIVATDRDKRVDARARTIRSAARNKKKRGDIPRKRK